MGKVDLVMAARTGVRWTVLAVGLAMGVPLAAQASPATPQEVPAPEEGPAPDSLPADPSPPRTLIRGASLSGFFLSPNAKVSRVGSRLAVFPGVRLGAILNRTVAVGLGLSLLANDVALTEVPSRDLELYYGGLEVELIAASNSVIHGSLRVLGGGGLLKVSLPGGDGEAGGADAGDAGGGGAGDGGGGDGTPSGAPGRPAEKILVVEPAADLTLNLTRMLRLSLGGGYRWTRAVDAAEVGNDDLTGWFAALSLRVGRF